MREDRIKRLWLVIGLVLAVVTVPSCRDMGSNPVSLAPGPTMPDTQHQVSFQTEIIPIFTKYGCASCHGGGGNLFVEPYSFLMQGGLHGQEIIPGNADGSNIIKKLTLSTPPFGERMPQGGPYLPDSTVQVIKDWINQGALNN